LEYFVIYFILYYISIKSDKFKTKTNTIIAGVCRDTIALPPFGEGCSPQYGKITILSPSAKAEAPTEAAAETVDLP